ncbi:MAG: hypothetical protein R3D44_03335 [Hyphomicrobiaceae bacterium]
MSRERIRKGAEPQIDLETVRETLSYMQADMRSSARLARVSEALGRVLDEIAALQSEHVAPAEAEPAIIPTSQVVRLNAFRPRFVPWSVG